MCRIHWLLPLCVALMCGLTFTASASRMSVSVDLKSRNTPVTLTVQGMDVSDVLSGLFNAANDTYELQTGVGISGTIDALQLTQVPFEDAVKAILAKVDAGFSYSKEVGGIYFIKNSADTYFTPPVPTLYAPTSSDPDMVVTPKITLPILADKDLIVKPAANVQQAKELAKPADMAGPPGGLLGGPPEMTGDRTGKNDKPVTEECYLAMIKIRNQPVHVFALGFGAEELPDYSTLSTAASSGTKAGQGYSGLNTNSYGSNYGTSSTTGSYVNGVYYPYGTSSGTTTNSNGTVTINGVTYTPTTTTSTSTSALK